MPVFSSTSGWKPQHTGRKILKNTSGGMLDGGFDLSKVGGPMSGNRGFGGGPGGSMFGKGFQGLGDPMSGKGPMGGGGFESTLHKAKGEGPMFDNKTPMFGGGGPMGMGGAFESMGGPMGRMEASEGPGPTAMASSFSQEGEGAPQFQTDIDMGGGEQAQQAQTVASKVGADFDFGGIRSMVSETLQRNNVPQNWMDSTNNLFSNLEGVFANFPDFDNQVQQREDELAGNEQQIAEAFQKHRQMWEEARSQRRDEWAASHEEQMQRMQDSWQRIRDRRQKMQERRASMRDWFRSHPRHRDFDLTSPEGVQQFHAMMRQWFSGHPFMNQQGEVTPDIDAQAEGLAGPEAEPTTASPDEVAPGAEAQAAVPAEAPAPVDPTVSPMEQAAGAQAPVEAPAQAPTESVVEPGTPAATQEAQPEAVQAAQASAQQAAPSPMETAAPAAAPAPETAPEAPASGDGTDPTGEFTKWYTDEELDDYAENLLGVKGGQTNLQQMSFVVSRFNGTGETTWNNQATRQWFAKRLLAQIDKGGDEWKTDAMKQYIHDVMGIDPDAGNLREQLVAYYRLG